MLLGPHFLTVIEYGVDIHKFSMSHPSCMDGYVCVHGQGRAGAKGRPPDGQDWLVPLSVGTDTPSQGIGRHSQIPSMV